MISLFWPVKEALAIQATLLRVPPHRLRRVFIGRSWSFWNLLPLLVWPWMHGFSRIFYGVVCTSIGGWFIGGWFHRQSRNLLPLLVWPWIGIWVKLGGGLGVRCRRWITGRVGRSWIRWTRAKLMTEHFRRTPLCTCDLSRSHCILTWMSNLGPDLASIPF